MAQFASEAFAGIEGDTLQAHSVSWAKPTGATGNAEIVSGRARQSAVTTAWYYHSGSPASADYSVNADIYMPSGGGNGAAAGVLARQVTGALTGYHARFNSAGTPALQLYKVSGGTFALLGSTTAFTAPSSGASKNIKIECVSDSIRLYWDGGATPIISALDANITAAGNAAIRWATSSLPSDTAGLQIDNFSADDPASGSTYNESLTDSAAASDTATAVHAGVDALADSAAATDSTVAALAALDALEDAGALTETLASALVIIEAVADSASAADSATGAGVFMEALTDALAASDAASHAATLVESVADTAALTESLASTAAMLEALADSIAATDAAIGSLAGSTYTEAIEDTGAATDEATATRVAVEAIADSASLSDALDAAAAFVVSLADSGALGDAATSEASFVDALADIAAAVDSVAGALAIVVALVDSGALTDDATDSLGGSAPGSPRTITGVARALRIATSEAARRIVAATRTRTITEGP